MYSCVARILYGVPEDEEGWAVNSEEQAIELDEAVAAVYGGALEDFVRRRDALAKELRAAGRREDATAVKALRKPSRLAWALDAAVLRAGESFDELGAAVAATLDAHATGGDVRDAIAGLRAAVRAFAAEAARLAKEADQRVDEAALNTAVLGVLGSADAFDALRAARLAEVPAAGGLDFLANLPAPPPGARRVRSKAEPRPGRVPVADTRPEPVPEPEPPPAPGPSPEELAARRAARRAAHVARDAVEAARRRADGARRTLARAGSELKATEERLRALEVEVAGLRERHEVARQESDDAADRLRAAEEALAEAEADHARLGAED